MAAKTKRPSSVAASIVSVGAGVPDTMQLRPRQRREHHNTDTRTIPDPNPQVRPNDPPALSFIHWSGIALDSHVLSYLGAFSLLTDFHILQIFSCISRVGPMVGPPFV
jgi:hypothetical protein